MTSLNKATILVLATWVAAASLLLAIGDACAGVLSMSVDAACRSASTGPAMFDLCMTMLSVSPPSSEATTYAEDAAGAAEMSCSSTADAGEKMLRDGSVTGDLREACSSCVGHFGTARGAMEGVGNQISRCFFADIRQGYMDALAALEACTAELTPVGGTSTPLYGMAVGDRDRTVIALRLGGLLMA